MRNPSDSWLVHIWNYSKCLDDFAIFLLVIFNIDAPRLKLSHFFADLRVSKSWIDRLTNVRLVYFMSIFVLYSSMFSQLHCTKSSAIVVALSSWFCTRKSILIRSSCNAVNLLHNAEPGRLCLMSVYPPQSLSSFPFLSSRYDQYVPFNLTKVCTYNTI